MLSRRVVSLARLVLASASPRRKALVRLLGLEWRAAPADIDEDAYVLSNPFVSALNVAAAKARASLYGPGDTPEQDEIVLSADTQVVAADGAVLAKPANAEAAMRMLRHLRGRPHQVLTGVVLHASAQRSWGGVISSNVLMREYTEAEIAEYVARGEPFDKAGGYAVQDTRFRPVAYVEGCYLNVIGLPLCGVAAGLATLGIEVRERAAKTTPPCAYCAAGAPLVALS